MVSTFKPGTSRSTCSTGLNAPNDFWWQWPCTTAFAATGAERQREAAGLGLAHQKLLEQQRMRADALGRRVRSQRQQFVAQGQQAARLEANDRHAARSERRIGRDQPVEFDTGVVDQAGREKRSAAAQRPASVRGLWNMDAVSGLDQHAQRGVEIFALIGAIEGVGEQHDLAAVGRAGRFDVRREHIAPPFRQRAVRADACEFLQQFTQQRAACCEDWRAGRSARPAPHSAADSPPAGP